MPARQAVAPRRCARRVVRAGRGARHRVRHQTVPCSPPDAADTGKARRRSARRRSAGVPREEQPLLLRRGDPLIVTRDAAVGRPARFAEDGRVREPARIGCTLPAAIARARRGEAIWFDDGKIGGVVESVHERHLLVRVTHAKARGERLRARRASTCRTRT